MKESRIRATGLEDLAIQAMLNSIGRGVNRDIMDQGWADLFHKIKYKMEDKGGITILIDRYFPSSKTCSVCGSKKDDLGSSRVYSCDVCGHEMNRDINAAINIKNETMRILRGQGMISWRESDPKEKRHVGANTRPSYISV